MAKTNIGEIACRTCGRMVIVKENENKTLSYRCDYCDSAPYEKDGSMAAQIWRADLKPISHQHHAPQLLDEKAKPEIETAPAPIAKPKPKNLFGV